MLKASLTLFFALAGSAVAQTFYGLNYGIDQNNCPPLEKYVADFKEIKKYTNRVRTYSLSVCNQGALALQAANQLDMNIYLGMWLDRPDTFEREMNALATMANNNQLSWDKVDALIAGSEVLFRGDTDANTMAGYLRKIRKSLEGKGIPITTADVYYEFPPVVVEQLDFLMMNSFPYWEKVPVEQAADAFMERYQIVVDTKAMGKPVKISETGWPSGGPNLGGAVTSLENQALYLSNMLCRTRENNIDLFWFSSMDEPYRPGAEGHWGIMTEDHTLKPGMKDVMSNPQC